MAKSKRIAGIASARLLAIAAIGIALFAVTGCGGDCAGVGYYALRLSVRDAAGHGRALGATVTLYEGSRVDTARAAYDTLVIFAAESGGGHTYDVKVSMPNYNDIWVRGVETPPAGCVSFSDGDRYTTSIPVTMTLAPNAAPVRSLFLIPDRILLDRSSSGINNPRTMRTILDADPGFLQGIEWRLAGDTASVIFDPRNGALTYRCRPVSGYLTLTARALADTTVVAHTSVAVQGHPAATSDPPC